MKKWKKFKDIEGKQQFPVLDKISYEYGDLLIAVDFSNGELKTVKCTESFSFRVIDEGNTFRTIYAQDFDGITWIFTTDSSNLIDWFNFESEFMYKDNLQSYIVATQNQLIEFLTYSEIEII